MKPRIELTINNKAEFYVLQDLLIATLIFIALSLFMLFSLDTEFFLYILFGFYFVMYFLPTMILYYNYQKFNRNKVFIFEEEKIIFDNNELRSENINKVTIWGTNQSINGISTSYGGFTHQAFFYIVIENKQRHKIYLTNLLLKNLIEIFEEYFPNTPVEKEIASYPFINNGK